MRLIYNNLIDAVTASAFTVVSENLNYPKDNLLDQRLGAVYRTGTPTAQSVTIDFGTAQSITVAAILGHNISTSATITIGYSSTSTSPFVPAATVVSITHSTGAMLAFFNSVSYRYWQFAIDDATNPDTYIEAGRLWLGTYLTVSPASLLDFTVKKKRSDTVTYGKHRQKMASIGEGWREFSLSFPVSEYAMIQSVSDMFDVVGNHSSLIFCNFDSLRTYPLVDPCYCSISGPVGFTHQGRLRFTYSLNLEEDK